MENMFNVARPILLLGKCLGLIPLSFIGPPRKGLVADTIVSKVVDDSESNELQKIDFSFSMEHMNTRNLNVENILFTIDWNVLLTVSIDRV